MSRMKRWAGVSSGLAGVWNGAFTFSWIRDQGRIVWLDVLRAVAIILVLWGHVFLVGMNDPVTSNFWVPLGRSVGATDYLFGPTTLDRNPLGHWGNSLTARFDIRLGGFGVALFFLVSGFVILRTLDRMRPGEFLFRRGLRIFPVSIAAVLLTAGGTYIYCASIGAPQPHSPISVLTSALAVNILFHQIPTTPVLWTLTTELLFYSIMAGVAAMMPRIGLRALVVTAAACLGAVILVHRPSAMTHLDPRNFAMLLYLAELIVYVSYMLIGCVLWRLYSGCSAKTALPAFVIVAGLTLYGYTLLGTFDARHPGIGLADAVLAIIVFGLAMILRPCGSWTLPFRWVADVSYPLYLVHVPLAWGILVVLAGWGMEPTSAGMISVVLALCVAWLLHVAVEQPFHMVGQRMTRKHEASSQTAMVS